MFKNNIQKNNKVLYSILALCLLVLFSSCLLILTPAKANADIQSIDIDREYVANDYIFEPESDEEFIATSDYELEAGDTDVSSVAYYCLRDDYVIYTQDQARNGFCWAFAGTMALGTTFMLETGEFYDFSEAWIGLARAKQTSGSYQYGDGGNQSYFNSVIKQYGLVLESDMTYDNSYLINGQDYNNYYDYYSQFANTTLYDNLQTATYTTGQKDSIKNHIYNNGGLSISMYWDTSKGRSGVGRANNYSYKYPSTGASGGHAITAIGWDDNVTATIEGKKYTGAWICLNFWGDDVNGDDDGVLYVFYGDSDVYGTLYGYKFSENKTSNLYFSNSIKAGTGNTTYQTPYKGKYYTGYTASTNSTKQRNIYFDNNVDITYQYDISENTKIDFISIFYDAEDVTTSFDITYDLTNREYTLKANDLPYGPYKVIVEYSNGSAKKEYSNIIYINNSADVANVTFNTYSSTTGISNNGYDFVYNSYNYADITIDVATTSASGTMSITYSPTSYSKVYSGHISVNYENLSATSPLAVIEKVITSTTGDTQKITFNINFVQDSSTQKLVNIYYDLDGGVNTDENYDREIINKTSGLVLADPVRKGFNFEGWYYDQKFTSPLTASTYAFNKVVQIGTDPNCYAQAYYNSYYNYSNIAFVYAKWSLKEPTGATLKASAETLAFAQNYTISINSVGHDLAKLMIVESVDWYSNGSKISTTNIDTLTQTATDFGLYTYYAVITLRYREQEITATTAELTVAVLDSISEINYANGIFSWSEVTSATSYNVTLYKISDQSSQPTEVATKNQNELQYSLLDKVSSDGVYYISVNAEIVFEGNPYKSAELISNPIHIFEISMTTFGESMKSIFVDKDTTINVQDPNARAGYTFEKWYIDREFEQEFVQNSTTTENVRLYAKWSMNEISVDSSIATLQRQYNKQATPIIITPTHASGLTNFEYKWEYKANQSDEQYELIENNSTDTLNVLNVADSGYYICTVSLVDSDGFEATTASGVITIKITRQATTINTEAVKNEYTYTGLPQAVDAGAVLLDNEGEIVSGVQFTYVISDDTEELGTTFTNVPLNGDYKLKISTNGTENYLGTIAYVYIKVNKAQGEINVEKAWQTYRYTGKAVAPTYTINNSEQVVDSQNLPINKGEYDVTLVAQESRNYKRATTQLHITIAPANIRIVANDVTSILFFQQKELSYRIEGEVFEGDDLNLELHADIDTSKIGTYDIAVTSSNDNYHIALEYGKYTVTGWPYYIGIAIIVAIAYFVIKALAKRRYQYEFESNGGDIVSPIDTKSKADLQLENPTREGYKFIGWYTDMELTQPFTGSFVKSKGKTLYAKWQKEVVDVSVETQKEEISVQQLVDDIDGLLNPKPAETEPIEEVNAKEEIKEPTEQERMEDIIGSISTNSFDISDEEMQKFIQNITEDKN